MVFVGALILVPIGMWLRHRKLLDAARLRRGAGPLWPRLDFNDSHLRNVTLVFLGLTFVNAVIFATAYLPRLRVHGVAALLRHRLPHGHVAGVHRLPGVAALARHLRAVSHRTRRLVVREGQGRRVAAGRSTTLGNTFSRPIHTPIENLRPARETCEHCHWPSKHHGDKLHAFVRYADDEENTPSYNAMLIKTGGGDLDTGRHGGIHWWHIYSDNKIRYIQGDERRISITWVELTNSNGEMRIYTRKGEDAPTAAEMEEVRTMDCIDCHNRPTHLFQFPNKAIDAIMETPPGPGQAPLLQARGAEGGAGQVPDPRRRHGGSEEGDRGLLRRQLPVGPEGPRARRAPKRQPRSTAAIVFPEMNTNWETHPNHIGHPDPSTDEGFPGCWRCHDDELATADGAHTIPQDCDNCHTFLVEDSPTPPEFASR